MISIIVPIYNSEQTITRCIDSILSQHYRDFELILVNDGSIDNSLSICKEFAGKDNRIVVLNKENGGVSSARNAGLDVANGEWISFVDSDDYIGPDFFPTVYDGSVDLYIQHRLPVGAIYGNIEEQIPSQVVAESNIVDFFSRYSSHGILRVPWAKIFKRSIIEENGLRFDLRFKVGEDTLFDQEYYGSVKKIVVLESGTYFYQRIEGGDERKYSQPIQVSLLYIDEFWKIYRRNGFEDISLLSFVINYFKHLSYPFFKSRSDYWLWKTGRGVMEINYELGCYSGLIGHAKYCVLKMTASIVRLIM